MDRKFGGRRHQLAIYLEELKNIKPIRNGNAKDLENFADVLDITIVNLREAGRYDELGNGSPYIKLQKKKIPQILLSQYQRWLYEKDKVESVQTLREWVIQEAEFQTVAHEDLIIIIKIRSDLIIQRWSGGLMFQITHLK